MYQAYQKGKVTFWDSDKMFNFSMKIFKIRLQLSSLPQNIFFGPGLEKENSLTV